MKADRSKRRGFTLVEIMLVVAIMGIVLAMGMPAIGRMLSKEGMGAAVRDFVKACSDARARAVLRGTIIELHIRPQDGTFSISGGAPAPVQQAYVDFTPAPTGDSSPVGSGRLSSRVMIEMCDVNFIEYKDEPEAVVRFYPNGTSDEFTLVLRDDRGEFRKISLEVVTALADVEMVQ